MRRFATIYFTTIVIIALTVLVIARPHRPAQVPNGTVYQCLTCHTVSSPSPGNGPRNDFGQEVEANYLDVAGAQGNVQWDPVLAALDSDGDGVSNGAELGDPNGAWSIGQADPGNPSDVTNPGDPSSVSAIRISGISPREFDLSQNYPNPFNPSTSIEFSIPQTQRVTLNVYNVVGEKVKTLVDEVIPAGSYLTTWDGTNAANLEVSSGTYIYILKAGKEKRFKKMLMLR
jgi:hypothetical protein